MASLCCSAGNANRNLRFLIAKPSIGFNVVPAAAASKSVQLGSLTITKGGNAATGSAPQRNAPEPQQQTTPAPAAAAPAAGTPAAATPAPAQTSAPVTLPRGAPVAGTNDINQVGVDCCCTDLPP